MILKPIKKSLFYGILFLIVCSCKETKKYQLNQCKKIIHHYIDDHLSPNINYKPISFQLVELNQLQNSEISEILKNTATLYKQKATIYNEIIDFKINNSKKVADTTYKEIITIKDSIVSYFEKTQLCLNNFYAFDSKSKELEYVFYTVTKGIADHIRYFTFMSQKTSIDKKLQENFTLLNIALYSTQRLYLNDILEHPNTLFVIHTLEFTTEIGQKTQKENLYFVNLKDKRVELFRSIK